MNYCNGYLLLLLSDNLFYFYIIDSVVGLYSSVVILV